MDNTKNDITSNFFVHPTAVVDEGAIIGCGSKIWHFTHVMSGATIGKKCNVGQNVYVAASAIIGDGVKIQNNVSIYDGVVIEDDVFLGPSMVFTNVKTPRAFISRKEEYLPTRICRGASIAANATIVCGTTVGRYALVGAGAVVTADVPAYALMIGVPARRAGWVSRSGATLRATSDGAHFVCPETGERYVLTSPDTLELELKEGAK